MTELVPKNYSAGEPCGHPGCIEHTTVPCGGCGRTWEIRKARTEIFVMSAVDRVLRGDQDGIAWVFNRCMGPADRDEFDLHLARIGSPLALEPGTTEKRFRITVENMVETERRLRNR